MVRVPYGCSTFFNRSIPAYSSCLESLPTPNPGTSVLSVHPRRCIRPRRDTDQDDLRPLGAPLARHVGPRNREHGPPAAYHSSLPRNGSRGNQLGPGYQKKSRGTMDSTAPSAAAEGEDEDDAMEDRRTAALWSAAMRRLRVRICLCPTRR